MGNQPSNPEKPNRDIDNAMTQRRKSDLVMQTEPDISNNLEPDILSRLSKNQRPTQTQPRPVTPNRYPSTQKESESGLNNLAFDIINTKAKPSKRGEIYEVQAIPLVAVKDINNALKFVEFHQSLRDKKGENIHLDGGPLLGFDLETMSETFPLNADVVPGRMSFSKSLNDFSQKYKSRVETFGRVAETTRLDDLKQDIRLQGNKEKALAEAYNLNTNRENRFFSNVAPLERELSPEFVFSQALHGSVRPKESSDQFYAVDKELWQPPEYQEQQNPIETQSRRAIDFSDVQGAIARITKKQEDGPSPQYNGTSPRTTSGPDSNRSTTLAITSSSNKKGRTSPQNNSLSNAGGMPLTFVIGKPEGTGKSSSSRKSARSPLRERGNVRQSPNTSAIGKKVSANSKNTSYSENQTVFLDFNSMKKTSSSKQSSRQAQDTAGDYKKKFWQEAEKPSSANKKTNQPKIESTSKKNERNTQPFSATAFSKNQSQNINTEKYPFASEYITSPSDEQPSEHLNPYVPVKKFDLASHISAKPNLLMISDIEKSNDRRYSSSSYQPESYEQSRQNLIANPIFGPRQSEPESRDLYDLLEDDDDDDIGPVEATIDLSAYLLRPDQAPSLQGPKDFSRQESSREGFKPDPQKCWQSDVEYRRNTESNINNKAYWQPDILETKKNISMDIRPRHSAYMQDYEMEPEEKQMQGMEPDEDYEERAENVDYAEDGEQDENNYLDGIKQRLARLSNADDDNFVLKADFDLSKGIEAAKKGFIPGYSREEDQDTENNMYLSNTQRSERALNNKNIIFGKKMEVHSAGFGQNRNYERYLPENI